MNLNDPFNRLSRRQQSEYATFQKSLRESPISSLAEANALLKNIWKRTWVIAAMIAGLAIVVSLFLPELKIIIITFGVLAILWLLTTTFKGQRLMRRYIAEEFDDTTEGLN